MSWFTRLELTNADIRRLTTLIEWGFARVEARLRILNRKVTLMAGELDALTQQVAETNTVIDSAITLIQGIKAMLDDAIASGNPAALTALSEALDAKEKALAQAILDNTPPTT